MLLTLHKSNPFKHSCIIKLPFGQVFNHLGLCNVSNIYICFLTYQPSIITLNFCKELKEKTNYKILIVVDDCSYNIPEDDGSIDIVKISKKESELNGYKSSVTWSKGTAFSRDKALYYFNTNNIDYEYVWFIEEDVFIPHIYTILNIDNKYPNYDLLCNSNNYNTTPQGENIKKWNWYSYFKKYCYLKPPYFTSMICAIRCSKKMLNTIHKYTVHYKTLFMDEVLFNTLAYRDNLSIKVVSELKNITWNNKFKFNNIKNNLLYHPIKNTNTHNIYRKKLNNSK